jgi:hypothetical protein
MREFTLVEAYNTYQLFLLSILQFFPLPCRCICHKPVLTQHSAQNFPGSKTRDEAQAGRHASQLHTAQADLAPNQPIVLYN